MMRTRRVPACPLCGKPGTVLYEGLPDRLTAAPERWAITRCAGRDCRALWLDPAPIEEDLAEAYRNYYTHEDIVFPDTWYRRAYQPFKRGYLANRYGYRRDTTPPWERALGSLLPIHPGRRMQLDCSVMHLPWQPGGRLLEVGCGSGNTLRVLRDLGWEVEGIDFDPNAVRNARRKGLTVHEGSLQSGVFDPSRFDAVLMSHVIEHVHDPSLLVQSAYRVLKIGGTLVVVTPNTEAVAHARFGRHWFSLDPPRHLVMFNPHNLERVLRASGFVVRRLRTSVREARHLWKVSRDIRDTGSALTYGAPWGIGDGVRRRPFSRRVVDVIGGAWIEYLAWGRLLVTRSAGEEIVAIAVKS
jgi:2-polyprenyl-3-methyl-5-hydroxy-6-metoxy-1,4-benzoquinol methylase